MRLRVTKRRRKRERKTQLHQKMKIQKTLMKSVNISFFKLFILIVSVILFCLYFIE